MAISDFHLNTDYPTDKIIYRQTVPVTVAAFTMSNIIVPHGVGFMPLAVGNYSPSATMSPLYSVNTAPMPTGFMLYDTALSSDNTNIYIDARNNTAASVTLYFNVYGYAPANIPDSTMATFTANDSDRYLINTETNMTKLLLDGVTAFIPDTQSFTISHNLGYLPQCIVWSEDTFTPRAALVNNVVDINNSISVTNTTVTFRNYSFSSQRYFYRIYADAI